MFYTVYLSWYQLHKPDLKSHFSGKLLQILHFSLKLSPQSFAKLHKKGKKFLKIKKKKATRIFCNMIGLAGFDYFPYLRGLFMVNFDNLILMDFNPAKSCKYFQGWRKKLACMLHEFDMIDGKLSKYIYYKSWIILSVRFSFKRE